METVEVFDEGADPHEFSVRLIYAKRLSEEEPEPAGLEVNTPVRHNDLRNVSTK